MLFNNIYNNIIFKTSMYHQEPQVLILFCLHTVCFFLTLNVLATVNLNFSIHQRPQLKSS